jgi:pimeloyl-ACP methyl ester carboxylesterase
MLKWTAVAAMAAAMTSSVGGAKPPAAQKPTIVLVHGAFADASSWNGVAKILAAKGYTVTAVANPLRGVESDATYLSTLVKSIRTPVVLVGHSYGGSVISSVGGDTKNVKALVYVAAFEPEVGESSLELTGKFPGSTLAGTLAPAVALPEGGHDLYIQQDEFPHQFAADVPADDASLMAVAQRPVKDAALGEKAKVAAWKHIPSWAVYGTGDLNIPPSAMTFMANRAKSKATVIDGASHVVMISHPQEVAEVILKAAGE